MEESEPKFAVDGMLGRLAKYLRALGYDTLYAPFLGEKIFTRGDVEGRIVVTKRASPPEHFEGRAVILAEGELERQLAELFGKLGVEAVRERVLTICLECNEPTLPVPPEEVEGIVPVRVRERVSEYRRCPRCEKVFWWGTHAERIMEKLERSGVFEEGDSV